MKAPRHKYCIQIDSFAAVLEDVFRAYALLACSTSIVIAFCFNTSHITPQESRQSSLQRKLSLSRSTQVQDDSLKNLSSSFPGTSGLILALRALCWGSRSSKFLIGCGGTKEREKGEGVVQ